MANRFYEPGEQRAARVQTLFGAIAPHYDLVNDLQSFGLHRYWKRLVVRLAQPAPGLRALDLCCGTGDLALTLTRQGVAVVGLDFSEPMLDVARRKSLALRSRLAPHFVRGDAQQIPFPENTFDIVTVGYGLRNLTSWEGGLLEMRRVARPGARLLVLDFAKPDNPLWRCLYFGYLRTWVPCLGLLLCGSASAYSYILESLKHYPAQHGIAAQMRQLGLQNVRTLQLLGGVMSISYAEKG